MAPKWSFSHFSTYFVTSFPQKWFRLKDQVYWFSSTNVISGKILFRELQPRILLSNQAADFLKLQYLKKEFSDCVIFCIHVDIRKK